MFESLKVNRRVLPLQVERSRYIMTSEEASRYCSLANTVSTFARGSGDIHTLTEPLYNGLSAMKALVWLHGEVKPPPFSLAARHETGRLLRRLQDGELLSLPHSRPMPSIGPRVHELRIVDEDHNWRVIYRIDEDAIVIAEVFDKKTQETPRQMILNCRRRLTVFDTEQG